MSSQLDKLAERRRALTERAAQQRTELARKAERWRTPLAYADRAVSAFHFIERHKIALAGAVGLFAVWKPRWVMRTARSGWLLWRIALGIARRWGG